MFLNPDNSFRQVFDLYELIPMGFEPQKIGMVVAQLAKIKSY